MSLTLKGPGAIATPPGKGPGAIATPPGKGPGAIATPPGPSATHPLLM